MDNYIIAQQNNPDPAQSLAPNNQQLTTSTTNPPDPVPPPGTDADGEMVIGVTGLWLLALVVAFTVFAFIPKLVRKFPKRVNQRIS